MSTAEYKREKYTQLAFYVLKDIGAKYQQAAKDFGLSQSEMIRLAVEEFIQNHAGGDFLPTRPVKHAPITRQPTVEKLSTQERTLLDEFNRLPVDVQKAFLKTFKAINAAQDADNQSASLQ